MAAVAERRQYKPRIKFEWVRDAAREIEPFTKPELGEYMGISPHAAKRWIDTLCEKGIIEPTGARRRARGKDPRGRLSPEYRYVKPRGGNVTRRREDPPEVAVLKGKVPTTGHVSVQARSQPVALKKRPKVTDPQINAILEKAWDTEGWRFERRPRAKHMKVFPPDGGPPISVPGTPSDHRTVKNVLAEFRRRGLDV